MSKFIDLTGKRFALLTVVERVVDTKPIKWVCLCDCGNTKIIHGSAIKQKLTMSCGCYLNKIKTKHGYYKAPEYSAWHNMKRRVLDKNHINYQCYGGRGITICKEWSGKNGFQNFIASIGPRPTRLHSLERIDNNGNYESTNVMWATKNQQSNNRRANIKLTFQGRTQNLSQWASELGMKYGTLRTRICDLGWAPDRALTEPVGLFFRKSTRHHETQNETPKSW